MSGYEVAFYPDALKDIKRLDGSQRKIVLKAIEKIRTNPLPQNEGGFGKPLGNKAGTDLTGFRKSSSGEVAFESCTVSSELKKKWPS